MRGASDCTAAGVFFRHIKLKARKERKFERYMVHIGVKRVHAKRHKGNFFKYYNKINKVNLNYAVFRLQTNRICMSFLLKIHFLGLCSSSVDWTTLLTHLMGCYTNDVGAEVWSSVAYSV